MRLSKPKTCITMAIIIGKPFTDAREHIGKSDFRGYKSVDRQFRHFSIDEVHRATGGSFSHTRL